MNNINVDSLLTELNNRSQTLFTEDGKPWPIPEDGSLGLLASGYEGLMAWRLVRTKTKEGQSHE